jgi:hypothetical protein
VLHIVAVNGDGFKPHRMWRRRGDDIELAQISHGMCSVLLLRF